MALTQRKVDGLKPKAKAYIEMDALGLGVRVGPSGNKSYQYRYRIGGRQQTLTLGDTRVLKLVQAQNMHREYMSVVRQGIDPKAQRAQREHQSMSLGEFIEGPYADKLKAEGKRSEDQVAMLRANFKALWTTPINRLTDTQLRKWQNKRAGEIAISSVNRYTNVIKAVTEYARVYKVVDSDPLADLKRMKQQDQTPDIRWLNEKQEARLRRAIEMRDAKLRGLEAVKPMHVSPNVQIIPADVSKLADAPAFGDHLKPIVLLMLDCGLRRQEALQLRWEDIKPDAVRDDQFQLFIRPSSDKTGKGRYVPLIRETGLLLHQWRQHLKATGRYNRWVFPNPTTGEPFKEVKSSWNTLISLAAKSMRSLEGTTLRDLRSTYGSKLLQRGVPILQVSKLLGHSSVTITERHYAALSDQGKREAVDTLSRLGNLSVVNAGALIKRDVEGA